MNAYFLNIVECSFGKVVEIYVEGANVVRIK